MPVDTLDDEPLIAFTLVAPMGWVESPPFFTALYDTASDLVYSSIFSGFHPRPHIHYLVPDTSPNPEPFFALYHIYLQWQVTTKSPVVYIDVYIDHFIGLSQVPPHICNRIRSLRFHAMAQIF